MKWWIARKTRLDPSLAVRFACWVGLAALGLMAWSVLSPSPLAVVVGMSLGHAMGIAAALLFGLAIYFDYRRERRRLRQGPLSRDALP